MISTINIPGEGSGVPKVLQPGNHTVTVNTVKLEVPPYNKDAINVVLGVEGPDMGETFEGFWVNKDDESLGRHKGQVASVKLSQYAFSDGTTKSGVAVKRDVELLRALQTLCKAFGCTDWLLAQNNNHDTMESLFAQFASDKPFAGKQLYCCIAGSEYTNKQGYTNFDLYFPRTSRGSYAYEAAGVKPSQVVTFDEEQHIRRKKVEPVQSFGDSNVTTSSSVGSDFEL
jgi:hypothetical protein